MNKIIKLNCNICGKETKKLGLHIKSHSLSMEDYYLKYNDDKGGKCLLEECNNKRPFINLSRGYSKFCSNSCSVINQHKNPEFKKLNSLRMKSNHSNPEFIKLHKEGMHRLHKNPEFYNIQSLRMKELHKNPIFSKMHSNRMSNKLKDSSQDMDYYRFLSKANKSDISEGVLYIMKFMNYIKIGICYFKDEKLSYFKKRLSVLKPLSFEIFKGSITEIAKYELDAKNKYTSVKETEYFSLDLYEEIKSKIPNTILPYSTLVV